MKTEVKKFRYWLGHTEKMTYPHTISELIKMGWEITPDMICMQFTGCKDKNGVEIYEGDIVQNKKIKGDVKWNNYSFVVYDHNDDYMLLGLASFWEFEVIGNIHENKELL